MSFGLAFIAFIFASGICVLLVTLVRSPVGFEDNNGFVPVRPVDPYRPSYTARSASGELRELPSRA